MSLLKPTNNLMSNIMVAGTKNIVPEVGMGATLCSYTDRSAATVIEVTSVRGVTYITVQEDNAKRIDTNGMCDDQDYEYTPNPEGYKCMFRFKNNKWEGVTFNTATNRYKKQDSYGLVLGTRDKFHDFSF